MINQYINPKHVSDATILEPYNPKPSPYPTCMDEGYVAPHGWLVKLTFSNGKVINVPKNSHDECVSFANFLDLTLI